MCAWRQQPGCSENNRLPLSLSLVSRQSYPDASALGLLMRRTRRLRALLHVALGPATGLPLYSPLSRLSRQAPLARLSDSLGEGRPSHAAALGHAASSVTRSPSTALHHQGAEHASRLHGRTLQHPHACGPGATQLQQRSRDKCECVRSLRGWSFRAQRRPWPSFSPGPHVCCCVLAERQRPPALNSSHTKGAQPRSMRFPLAVKNPRATAAIPRHTGAMVVPSKQGKRPPSPLA
ncbi:hypothetical protein EJ04DRAFT_262390 [Polyplosphaeria fusca]|uniref:Uncharacterized protein n=1 Tax=Polyplosphaeria fusca TaxID=682080 RepID=A0A9P4R645_9PLEO|nr:hypothetical protein EJ04DRAFT_262390 [Polyplosphaeria fusca]